ncbi:hypothetical protein [Candidatus Amarolinea aalborgensis]|uniref:hypothetical protein n=1 Tax=Candidatus Amarolinea aalborgensis TaxID=2249329 RepID=UPI003BF98770
MLPLPCENGDAPIYRAAAADAIFSIRADVRLTDLQQRLVALILATEGETHV